MGALGCPFVGQFYLKILHGASGADPEKILTRSTLMASEASQKNIGGPGGTPPEKILKPNPLDWLRTLFQENFLRPRPHAVL